MEEMITYINPKLPWSRNQGRGRIEELMAWVENERESSGKEWPERGEDE